MQYRNRKTFKRSWIPIHFIKPKQTIPGGEGRENCDSKLQHQRVLLFCNGLKKVSCVGGRNWTGMIGALTSDKADLALQTFVVLGERTKVIEFSAPLWVPLWAYAQLQFGPICPQCP